MNLGPVTDEDPAELAKQADEADRRRNMDAKIGAAVQAAEAMARGTGRTHAVMVSFGVVRIVDVERTKEIEFVGVVGVAQATRPIPWFWLSAVLVGFLMALVMDLAAR